MLSTTAAPTGHSTLTERVRRIAFCARFYNLLTVHGLPEATARRRARKFAAAAAAKVEAKLATPAIAA
jgi:hypothetical protein